MSALPKCRLCGAEPTRTPDGKLGHKRGSRCKLVSAVYFNDSEWRTLMGRGEPVAWRPKLAQPIPYVTGAPRESDLKHWEESMGVEIEYAYAGQPAQAPAVDSAVLRDAARYRWLREQHWSKSRVVAVIDPKTSVRLGQYCPSLDLLDLEIDTAMNKGEG